MEDFVMDEGFVEDVRVEELPAEAWWRMTLAEILYRVLVGDGGGVAA